MIKKQRIFGPVPSRRLGFSLGVDVVPFKTCSLDCLYCQLGPTTDKTRERKEYVSPEEIVAELSGVLKKGGQIDWITFSGSGEPTLNSRLGEMIRKIKKFTTIPVAVLTNGTLLGDPQVREELAAADLVIPDLDAGTEETFQKINRPPAGLSLKEVGRGIADFTKEFSGSVWLEVVLLDGINDREAELEEIARWIGIIKPERVQLNTAVRPASSPFARAVNPEKMGKIRTFLSEKIEKIPVEVVADFEGEREKVMSGDIRKSILIYLARRPATLKDLSAVLGLHRNEVVKYLAHLREAGKIREYYSGSEKYFVDQKWNQEKEGW